MKILMIASFLPYPLFSGGHIRLYNLLKNLSRQHEITLVCEKRNYQNQKDINEISDICKKVITVNRKKQWTLENILKTGFSFSSFLITGHTNSEMKKEIKNLLENEKFDLIHVETSYIMQNIPQTSIPLVLIEHNVEYMVYKKYADTAPLFLRPLLNIDIAKLKREEEGYWQKADFLVAVSEEERKIMERKNKKTAVVPNGVDITKFKIQNSKFKIEENKKKLLYIGDFKWMQNKDAINWIIKKIWPQLKFKISTFSTSRFKINLWIVGRNIPEDIKNLKDEDIIIDENAHDASEVFRQAYLLLAPIRVGGGTSYKILEAMASGVPVLTTSLGANPLDAINNKDIVVAESDNDMTDKIIKLLNDEKFYKEISINARRLVVEKYDWKKISKKLDKVYRLVIRTHY